MEPMGVLAIFILIAIIIWVMAMFFDDNRIKNHIEENGGELLTQDWAPFGKGWAGDRSDRIYRVTYKDKQGNIHEAYVKTSMFSGVYFTQDKIITPAANTPTPEEINALKAEVKNLQEELDRLKKEKDSEQNQQKD